jgi:hypothetical protein
MGDQPASSHMHTSVTFSGVKVVGIYCSSFSFNDCCCCGSTYPCIMPVVVLKGAQYMFTSNVNDHRVDRQLNDTCVIIRGFNSDVESDLNFEGYVTQ